jgi:hypothetical protein
MQPVWRPVPVRAVAGWATATMLSVSGFALVNLLDAFNPLVEMWAVDRAASTGGGTPAAVARLTRLAALGLLVLLYGLGALCFLVWLNRCRRNLAAFADARPSWPAGMTVAIWFIPLANLIGPPFAVTDVVRNSVPADRRGRLIAAVRGWWALLLGGWVAMGLGLASLLGEVKELSRLREQLAAGETVDRALAAEVLGNQIAARLPSAALFVAAAVLLVVVVARVTEAQYARWDAFRQRVGSLPKAPVDASIFSHGRVGQR